MLFMMIKGEIVELLLFPWSGWGVIVVGVFPLLRAKFRWVTLIIALNCFPLMFGFEQGCLIFQLVDRLIS